MKAQLNVFSTSSEWDSCIVVLELVTGSVSKFYTYKFPSPQTWKQYYYHFSYPVPDSSLRKIKLSILAAIKQYKRKE